MYRFLGAHEKIESANANHTKYCKRAALEDARSVALFVSKYARKLHIVCEACAATVARANAVTHSKSAAEFIVHHAEVIQKYVTDSTEGTVGAVQLAAGAAIAANSKLFCKFWLCRDPLGKRVLPDPQPFRVVSIGIGGMETFQFW